MKDEEALPCALIITGEMVVHVVSSCAGREPEGMAKRYNRKERCIVELLRPFSMQVYNKHMGGVDLMDSVAR